MKTLLKSIVDPFLLLLALCAVRLEHPWSYVTRNYRNQYWRLKLGKAGKNLCIDRYVVIRSPELVSIGDDVHINDFVHIWGGGGVHIGDKVMIASQTVITSLTHNPDTRCHFLNAENFARPVCICDNVWLGAGVIVLPGVTIHEGAVIGAGSVVTGEVPPGMIMAGVPAKAVRARENLQR